MRRNGQPGRRDATVARQSGRELVVTRTFDSPTQAVFEAWTRPELFRLWWAPKSMGAVLSACEIDARTGGGYRLTFGDGASDSASFFGKYLEVTPPSRLVWTNEESEGGPVTTVTLEDRRERTLLVLSELYPSAEAVPDAAGMQAMAAEQFDQLDELLASQRRTA
ncbi:SRPBCC domain-containing protein [Phenylobacterium soli]|uniref:ATPase n=1 Tax=Phenylobacterium soli TaxID=2170551 RepID=A0A328AMK1_9CAUL|nr:SRPBCC domain-containing protein [Phenylobacterium soli]RAK55767.1 ATPase [Phenylobacterium soli]